MLKVSFGAQCIPNFCATNIVALEGYGKMFAKVAWGAFTSFELLLENMDDF